MPGIRAVVNAARGTVCATLVFGLYACGNGASSPAPAVPIDVTASSKLQFGVGTATINTAAGSIVGTNFTMTFRGADGNNATGVNVPTITGPPSFAIGFAGSPNSIHGLSQPAFAIDVKTVQQTGSFPVDFQESLGPYAGVFGYGMANDNQVSSQLSVAANAISSKLGNPFCTDLQSAGNPTQISGNEETSGVAGQPNLATGTAVSSEIGLPLGSANANGTAANCTSVAASLNPLFANQQASFPINYYGGPPAWPSPQGYGAPSYFIGFGLGFTDSPAVPVVGTYQLNVAYPTSADYSTSSQVIASAQLHSTAPLPLMPMPTLVVNADGSGIVSVVIPPGLYESIVEVRTDNCLGGVGTLPATNYSQVLHGSGAQIVPFASHLGPPDSSGSPSRTFCSTTGTVIVSVLGFDYPAYESSYPFDNSMAPKITNGDGHTGQADVTTSPPLVYPSMNAMQMERKRMTRDSS